jgi:phenylacetate-CoA ligase
MEPRDLYAALFRGVLLPGYQQVIRRRPTLRLVRELEKTQWSSLDELLALQARDLRRLLDHAYANVPWYRARLDEIGARPTDFRTVSDLAKLPILTRAAAREAGVRRRSTTDPLPVIAKSTGGSSGEPLSFAYDLGSEWWRQAVKARGYAWAGSRPGEPSLLFWGGPVGEVAAFKKAKIALDRAFKRESYVNCTLRDDAAMEAAVAQIRVVRPRSFICFTQAGAELARYINARGLRTWDTISVLCGAERLFPTDRDALEQAFGPAVFETYGCREVMMIGSECDAHDGLHQSMENMIVEVVVTEGNEQRPARPGEIGEVVVTDLHNYGMPFIRYANGDLAQQGDETRCVCGRSLLRLGPIEGRVTETLRDGAGTRVSGLLFSVVFSIPTVAATFKQFQAVQRKDGGITLKVVPAKAGRVDESVLEPIRASCREQLKGIEVSTLIVPEIPLSKGGKRQLVVVE